MPAWWTVDERSPEVHRGEREREAGKLPHELAELGAAYAGVGDREARERRAPKGEEEGDSGSASAEATQNGDTEQASDDPEGKAGGEEASGEGESGSDEPAEEGGAD